MADEQHPLERRAAMLGERFAKRVDLMANLMRPDGRALFSQRLPEQQALTFWRKHRNDELGQAVLSTWSPVQVLELDQRLMRANEANGTGLA
jgi:hypothetical protein